MDGRTDKMIQRTKKLSLVLRRCKTAFAFRHILNISFGLIKGIFKNFGHLMKSGVRLMIWVRNDKNEVKNNRHEIKN